MPKPRIQPRRWSPPRNAGRIGPFAPNDALATISTFPVTGGGPEDIAVEADGHLVTGLANGDILRMSADGRVVERIAQTGGRPLGIEVDADGSLIVCDAHRGLLRVDGTSGRIHSLVSEVAGRPLVFTNNAAIAADGSVYFSESSQRFGLDHFTADLLEHSSTGRILRWNPNGSVDVIATGLDFANGVALSEDGSVLLVAETAGYCVSRIALEGTGSGARTVIVENLPGFPDNMSTGTNGVFWMAMPSERNALLDRLLPRPGLLRSAVWALPEKLQPEASHITWVVGLDADGEIRHNLQGPGRSYHYVTGVREHEGRLYLGSLVEASVGMVDMASASV